MNTLQKNKSLAIQMKGVKAKTITIPVASFKEASEKVSQYISMFDLGASTFKSAIIFHPTNGAFAHVSYNGRIWEGAEISSFKKTEIKF